MEINGFEVIKRQDFCCFPDACVSSRDFLIEYNLGFAVEGSPEIVGKWIVPILFIVIGSGIFFTLKVFKG